MGDAEVKEAMGKSKRALQRGLFYKKGKTFSRISFQDTFCSEAKNFENSFFVQSRVCINNLLRSIFLAASLNSPTVKC